MTPKSFRLILIIVIILLLIGINLFFISGLKNGFYFLSANFSRFLWKTSNSISAYFKGIISISDLEKENLALKQENSFLLFKANKAKALEQQNELLRIAVGSNKETHFSLEVADTISKDTDKDFLLISGGLDKGIKKGMPVVTKDLVLVGSVEQVFPNFSRVKLITSASSIFDVEIKNKNIEEETSGIAKGKGDLQLNFDLVPNDKKIQVGDYVFTVSLGGCFPKGLLVGRVKKVEKNDVKSSQKGTIEPYFLRDQLETLFVIKNFSRINF